MIFYKVKISVLDCDVAPQEKICFTPLFHKSERIVLIMLRNENHEKAMQKSKGFYFKILG